MRLALECPTELLENIQPLADFDWILAHLVLSDDGYANFYAKSTRYKVLDNSVHELREPMELEELKEAADRIKADLVVAPDYLNDHFSTIDALEKATKLFGKERILPVVQGHEYRYILECFDYILKMGFDKTAIPARRATGLSLMAQKRKDVVTSLVNKAPIGFRFHLLGMTTLEELYNADKLWIESIDTGCPVLYGLKGIKFGVDDLPAKLVATMNQLSMDEYDYNDLSLVYYNIAFVRRILNVN